MVRRCLQYHPCSMQSGRQLSDQLSKRKNRFCGASKLMQYVYTAQTHAVTHCWTPIHTIATKSCIFTKSDANSHRLQKGQGGHFSKCNKPSSSAQSSHSHSKDAGDKETTSLSVLCWLPFPTWHLLQHAQEQWYLKHCKRFPLQETKVRLQCVRQSPDWDEAYPDFDPDGIQLLPMHVILWAIRTGLQVAQHITILTTPRHEQK